MKLKDVEKILFDHEKRLVSLEKKAKKPYSIKKTKEYIEARKKAGEISEDLRKSLLKGLEKLEKQLKN